MDVFEVRMGFIIELKAKMDSIKWFPTHFLIKSKDFYLYVNIISDLSPPQSHFSLCSHHFWFLKEQLETQFQGPKERILSHDQKPHTTPK